MFECEQCPTHFTVYFDTNCGLFVHPVFLPPFSIPAVLLITPTPFDTYVSPWRPWLTFEIQCLSWLLPLGAAKWSVIWKCFLLKNRIRPYSSLHIHPGLFYYIHLASCHGPIPAMLFICSCVTSTVFFSLPFLLQPVAVFTETIPRLVESLRKYEGLLRVCHASYIVILYLFL
jgi:hypothetical protein